MMVKPGQRWIANKVIENRYLDFENMIIQIIGPSEYNDLQLVNPLNDGPGFTKGSKLNFYDYRFGEPKINDLYFSHLKNQDAPV
jgi:hypothetical protein